MVIYLNSFPVSLPEEIKTITGHFSEQVYCVMENPASFAETLLNHGMAKWTMNPLTNRVAGG